MESLNIGHLEVRYHLTPALLGEGERLDRILNTVLDDFLEQAIERVGIPVHEEICIREINVPIRLRLSSTDLSMALAWSLALAETIRQAVEKGNANWVVHYRSRVQGLIDFAVGVARGDLRRAWAWRQLGFGNLSEGAPAQEAAHAFYIALEGEATLIVPVLCYLAEQGYLPRIATLFRPEWWVALAREALRAAGVAPALPSKEDQTQQDLTGPSREATRGVRRALAASSLVRSAAGNRERLLRPRLTRFAFAALALLETESAIFRRTSHDRGTLLVEAANIMVEMSGIGPSISSTAGGREKSIGSKARDRGPASLTTKAREEETRLNAERTTGDDFQQPETAFSKQELRRIPPAFTETQRSEDDESTTRDVPILRKTHPIDAPLDRSQFVDPGEAQWPAVPEAEGELPLPDIRQRGFTRMGGLLFLVGIVENLGIPGEITTIDIFKERPFRWVLNHLGCLLANLEPEDSAALAFAGLGPASRPPTETEPPIEEEELNALGSWMGRVVETLRERLGWWEMPEPMLLDRICRRRAQVVADPGWIEVHLSLDEVSTDIRKAGLDLNPGYIQWLGVVIKFVYE